MSDQLVDIHLNHLRAKGKSHETVESRRDLLGRLNRHLPYGLLFAATEQLEGWLAGLRQRGRAKATLYAYTHHCKAFYRWAAEAGYLDGDPAATLTLPTVPRGIPKPCAEEELSLILTLDDPMLTAVILAGFAGLRRGEIVRAERDHITEEMVYIPRGKGEEPGTVPTHPLVWEHVRDKPSGLLVRSATGRRMPPHDLSVMARKAFDGLGLPKVHMHRLRHRYGTLIQEAYGDLRLTQECMRHKTSRSTEVYTLVKPGRRAAAVTTLPVPVTTGPAEL